MTKASVTFSTKDYRIRRDIRDAMTPQLEPCTSWYEGDSLMVRTQIDTMRSRFIDSIPYTLREYVEDVRLIQEPQIQGTDAFHTALEIYRESEKG